MTRRPAAVTSFVFRKDSWESVSAFYADVLGWEAVPEHNLIFTGTKGPIKFMLGPNPSPAPTMAVSVDRLEERLSDVKRAGGQVLWALGPFALVSDPAGGTLVLAQVPILNQELLHLAEEPRLLRVPAMTKRLLGAIAVIGDQYASLGLDEESRLTWEKDQNISSGVELEALRPLFDALGTPRAVLEIGPGLGRSAVYFSKALGWSGTRLDLFEGDGDAVRYMVNGPRREDSFSGDIELLKHCLDFNGVTGYRIIDAHRTPLRSLSATYDFLYSFYAVGYHWKLESFWDDIAPLIGEQGAAAFTVPGDFSPFPALAPFHWTLREIPKTYGYGAAFDRSKLALLAVSPNKALIDRLREGSER